MAVELATAYVSLVPSTKGLAAQVRREVGGPLEDAAKAAGISGGRGFGANLMSNAVSGLDRLGDNIVGKVTTAAKIAGAVGAGLIGAGLAGGLKRVLDTEDATIAFRQMGLSVEEIQKALKGVDRTFDGTPFANPDGFNIAAQLLSSGRELNQIEDDLRAIANVTAQTLDKDLQRTSETFLRIAATGRAYAVDMNSLALQGIPMRQILAEALGVTVSQLNDLVSAGEVTFDTMMDIINATERFEDAAKGMGSSTRGAFANVRTGVARLGESFLGPLFGENGYMVQSLLAIRQALRRATPHADALGQSFAEWLVPNVEKLADRLTNDVVPALREFSDWVSTHRDQIAAIGASVGTAAVGIAGLATFVNLLGRIARITPAAAVLALASGLVFAWQNSEQLRDTLTGAFDTVESAVTPVVETIEHLWGVFSEGTGVLDGIVGVIGTLFGADVQNRVWAFGQAVTDAWEWIRETATSVADWFSVHVGPTVTAVADLIAVIWEDVAEDFAVAWEYIRDVWDVIGEPILAAFAGWMRHLGNAWSAMWDGIVVAAEVALALLRGTAEFFTGLLTGDWAKAMTGIETITDALWEAVKSIFVIGLEFLIGFFANHLETIGDIWSATWNSVKTLLANAWDEMVETVSADIDRIIQFFRDLPANILDALGDLSGLLRASGRSLLGGFVDGIRSVATAPAGAIGRALSIARDQLPFSPAKEGPFSGKGWTTFSGKAIAEGLAEGMTQGVRMVKVAAEDLAAAAHHQGSFTTPAVVAAGTSGEVRQYIYGDPDPRTVFRARNDLAGVV